ncbi:MAG: hypothetical protein HYZ47_03145 [Simkania negevensis]|nr:hypothetical protein [Simkania negevensis]
MSSINRFQEGLTNLVASGKQALTNVGTALENAITAIEQAVTPVFNSIEKRFLEPAGRKLKKSVAHLQNYANYQLGHINKVSYQANKLSINVIFSKPVQAFYNR